VAPLWVFPVVIVVIVVIGMAMLVLYVRGLGTAADDLREHFEHLGEGRLAVDRLRADTATARTRPYTHEDVQRRRR
jgi:hypothetical protein